MKELPKDYIFPCENQGECRAILLHDELGILIEHREGYRSVKGIKFRCCTQCHLPIHSKEATRLNKLLGRSLEDVVIDPDFLELLNGID